MSRFSKAEAEARGWTFVHDRPEHDIVTSETQGETRHVPRSIRAEKYLSLPGRGVELINEEAETLGKLLERIHAFEVENLEAKSAEDTPIPIDEMAVPINDAGLPQRTVIGPGDVALTEEEWASRSRTDAIYREGEGMQFFGPRPEAAEVAEEREEIARDREDEFHAERDVGETEQISIDTSNRIDAPGQSAGSTLVVQKGEESFEDVRERREAEAIELENERVVEGRSVDPSFVRDDIPAETIIVEESPSAGDIRLEAEEEAAKEARDDDPVEGAKVEAGIQVREAGAEAEQEAHDEQAEQAEDDQQDAVDDTSSTEKPPNADVSGGDNDVEDATVAARRLASEREVNLSEVNGTGKDGRVTKDDVERFLAER